MLDGKGLCSGSPRGSAERNADGSQVTHRLRIVFSKAGRAAMLSHLEVAHALERTVRRAGLPYAVSNGFSPHMRIAFGSALPVGVGGTCEIADVLLVRRVDADEALAALQASAPPALGMESCAYIGAKEPSASAAFPYSTYEAVFDRVPDCSAEQLPFPDEVTVIRKKKERALRVADYLQPGYRLDGDVLRFVLKSGSNGSLRPDVLLRETVAGMGGVKVLSITRTCQFA